jgi:hypothetical protein
VATAAVATRMLGHSKSRTNLLRTEWLTEEEKVVSDASTSEGGCR